MLHEDEIARLRELAAADPTQTVPLCDLLVAAGRPQEAVRLCRTALRERPDDVDLRLALGRALSAAGELEEAQAALFDAVARKRRITRQNTMVSLAPPAVAPAPPPPAERPGPAVEAVPVPVPLSPTLGHGRRPSATALRSPSGEGTLPVRKLPTVGLLAKRPLPALPRASGRFPLSGPQVGVGDEIEPPPPVPDIFPATAELTGTSIETGPPSRPPSGVPVASEAVPPASSPASPGSRTAVPPTPGVSLPLPLAGPGELPAELADPVLPLPALAGLDESPESEEPSLAAGVLAAAGKEAAAAPPHPSVTAAEVPAVRTPEEERMQQVTQTVVVSPPPILPVELEPLRLPSAPLPMTVESSTAPAPSALQFDIESTARRLMGPEGPLPGAPVVEPDRIEVLFDRRRRRAFTTLWISFGLVCVGIVLGWLMRVVTTAAALRRRLEEGTRLAATARYEDLRRARDLYLEAARLAPHDPRPLALGAEAEARLSADHGEGSEESALILWRRAEQEAMKKKGRGAEVRASLRRAQMLLALSRGEPCPVLPPDERERSQQEDGDVAARCALQRGEVTDALRILSHGSLRNVDQLLWRGAVALSQGDIEEADHAYRTVLDLIPGHPRALLGRGMVLVERGQDPTRAGFPAGSEALGHVGEAWHHLLRALVAIQRGEDAAEELQQAEPGARFDARLALWLGRVRLHEGRVADAEVALRWAYTLSPADPELTLLDAEVALSKGHHNKVVRALSAMQLAPGSVVGGRLLGVLGRALYQVGRYQEAGALLDQVLAAHPGDIVSRTYRLLCRARLGAERDAFQQLEQLVSGAPTSTAPHYGLAVLAYERRDLDRAAAAARQALHRNPDAAQARALLGRVLWEQGRYAEAIAELERVAQEAPATLLAHRTLGRIYLELERPREARLAFRRVADSGQASIDDYLALVDAVLASGGREDAERVLQEAQRAGVPARKLRRGELILAALPESGQTSTAAPALEAERRANPGDLQLAQHTAAAWLRAGEPAPALAIYKSIRRQAPLRARLGAGRALLWLHRAQEAEAAFREALAEWERAPYPLSARAEAHGGLCRALLLRGALTEAAQEAEAAIREAPKQVEGPHCQARLLNAQGQILAAVAAAEQAVNLDTSHLEACVLLADLTYKVKKVDLARLRYQRCLELAAASSQVARYVRNALSLIR
ncbi:MAG: tetratricopeptide repeat protein [Myxococcales bacterium]|nr:tetratricopeptide repeat protein [Myxococcota bacterium]MDW8281893.1 tetratricopeptide repeat protein [Myxococcales bacterium]